MAAYVLRHAQALRDKPALEVISEEGVTSWTYGDIGAQVQITAQGFLASGLAPGQTLLMRLGNRLEFPIAYLAALWVGIIPVPSSAQLTGSEITKLSERLRPDAILAEPGIALPDTCTARVISLEEMRDFKNTDPIAPQMGDPNRHGYTIFTSGSSGAPQGVRHAHRAIWARQMMHEGWYGMTRDDRVLHAGAFNWTYTLGTGLMDPWSLGATALIPAPGTTPDRLAAIIAAQAVTIFAAAPGVYRQMLKTPLPAMPALRHGLSAGEALLPSLRSIWNSQTGTDLHEALGMSECSTFISGSPKKPAPESGSGWPQSGRRIAVLDENGAPVPYGTSGLLAVSTRDAGLMLGYLGEPDLTGDWFITGDVVVMEKTGAIAYCARADDVMTAGGYRIAPGEVEAAFATLPGLEEVAATQVRIASGATLIALFYSGARSDEQKLRAHAQNNLARYKQPRLYIHIPNLPKGPNGKLNRRTLAASYEARDGQA